MLFERPDWWSRAACRGRTDEFCLFLPSRPSSADRNRMQAALAVCAACPVIDECRQAAIAMPDEARIFGSVVGGLTPGELNALRRAHHDARPRPACGSQRAYIAHLANTEHCRICLDAHAERVSYYKRRKRDAAA
jgi:WhiB family redox-sensing transcriptional regulator